MKNQWQTLLADTQRLREEIGLGPILESALNATHQTNSLLRSQLIARSKRVTYVHGIVSIYGLIEEHVDNTMMEIATAYQEIFGKYSDLPSRVQESHREYSLRCLLDGDRARSREPMNANTSLSNLAAIYNDASIRLNVPAFTYSTSNYRHGYIREMFRRLDIDVAACGTAPDVLSALTTSGLQFRDAEKLLLDLVDRRNEVAHSYQTPNLLDIEVLAAYLDVIAAYLKALLLSASTHLLRLLALHRLRRLGVMVKSWTNAIGVDMTDGQIQAPCAVLLVKEPTVHLCEVMTLQTGGAPLSGLVEYTTEKIELGMGLTTTVPAAFEGSDVFVLPHRWLHLGT